MSGAVDLVGHPLPGGGLLPVGLGLGELAALPPGVDLRVLGVGPGADHLVDADVVRLRHLGDGPAAAQRALQLADADPDAPGDDLEVLVLGSGRAAVPIAGGALTRARRARAGARGGIGRRMGDLEPADQPPGGEPTEVRADGPPPPQPSPPPPPPPPSLPPPHRLPPA